MSNGENADAKRTLYVELDGALVTTDSFRESVCLFVRHHPSKIPRLLVRRCQGRRAFEAFVCERVSLDVSLLPYRRAVLELIRRGRETGRRIVLVSSRPESIARAVADYLGVFDDVLASNETRDLRGDAKLEVIRTDRDGRDFDYVGASQGPSTARSRANLAIWDEATHAYVAGDSEPLRKHFEARNAPWTPLTDGPGLGRAVALGKALRPHQWVKNVLLFAPLVLAQALPDPTRLRTTCLAFLAFCAVASAGYLANDLLDIESDRRHPTKRNRPLATGNLSVRDALRMMALLLALGVAIAWILVSGTFTGMLVVYLVLTLAYSLVLKEMLFLDVLTLASLYTHRVFAGAVASSVEVSPWLLVFSVFFFIGLAMLKRYVELLQKREAGQAEGGDRGSRRAYSASDTRLMETMGISSGYVSVLVLGLYTSRSEVTSYYSYPDVLWLVLPLLIYWISRIWFLASRGDLPDDPVSFALTDRTSYFVFAGILIVGVIAMTLGSPV